MPPKSLPPGVKLHRTFEGHTGTVNGLALDPSGQILASAGNDMTIKLWDTRTGDLLRSLVGHQQSVWSVAFHPDGRSLASGSADGTVRLWETSSGNELYELKGPKRTDYARHVSQRVWSIAYDPDGQWLVSGHENAVVLWNTNTGDPLRTYETQESSEQASDRYAFQEGTRDVVFDPTAQMVVSGHGRTIQVWDRAVGNLIYAAERHSAAVKSVAIHPSGSTLVSGSLDRTIMVWELSTGKLLRTLEGHTGSADAVAFSPNGQLLASKSRDGTVRLWRCDTWDTVAVIPVATHSAFLQSLAFHPTARQLFTSATTIDQADVGISRLIYCLELDLDQLLSEAPVTKSTRRAVHHTTAKIVLVGDHSVGKSGLAWRLAHGEFKEQSSTHGQQFWVLPQLGKLREDGTECEAILWDLAGQPDYRLIHALFLDDVDLALVLFDSSHLSDPLHGVEFWLKHLNSLERGNQAAGSSEVSKGPPCFIILIGAQADRGTPTLTFDELETFCRQRGVSGYISTSAKTGAGIEALIQRMKDVIPWDDKPATVTTVTFKRIKDFVLKLKENLDGQELVIVTPQELRQRLERQDPDWKFSDEEVVTAVGHLENYGYAKRLRTSKGELRVLLVPELLNNLAASFVLEARKNEKGLGSLEEKRVLAGEYPFPELEKLPKGERDILLDSAALLFLKHNICFRETDPLNVRSYLVFPQLINLKKPTSEEEQTEDGMVYTVSGAIENVYASLVVLLGYTQTFTRTNQWHNHARYEVGEQFICGFRQELEREGELEFILYFGG
ncbi:MAG TPA: hypothetical protein VJT50_08955, partial [Pyrinomonadaceae bacterium]|nr:hypothetical protein [Pyrinomonadaceae bacterium]